MKSIVKKILKTLFVFIISTIIIYLVLTITAFYHWGKENQMFINMDRLLVELDSEKIQELGDRVGNYEKVLEDSLDKSYYEENSDYHSLAEYYDPLGISVWTYMHMEMENILNKGVISVLSGISITIAYVLITSKKINSILKIAIGYFGPMLIIPPIYMYSWTYRFWDIFQIYRSMPKYFYIGYTVVFILMYIINYRIGVRMTRELNQTIENSKSFK